jgi:hypothetical protein
LIFQFADEETEERELARDPRPLPPSTATMKLLPDTSEFTKHHQEVLRPSDRGTQNPHQPPKGLSWTRLKADQSCDPLVFKIFQILPLP